MVWLIPGSGRVTFNNHRSYLKAVTAAFVEIKTTKFTKKVSGAGEATHGRGLCHGWCWWEHQCSWALPHIPGQAAQSGAVALSALGVLLGMDLRYPGERAVSLVFHAHCLLFLQVQIDPYLEDSMCQVCNAQPGPFFCRDQVRPVLLQLVLRGFLQEEQALPLGFGDMYTGSSPVGKMRPIWEDGLVLEEVQPSWGGQFWYLPGGSGKQYPPGFEPALLQFAGTVPALGTGVGSTGAPEGRLLLCEP